MANDTFGQIWNRVILYAPDLPPVLAQEFVKQTYSDVVRSHYWSELRRDSEVLLPNLVSAGTITVTHGSPTVTGSGTGWTSAIQYRQLAVNNIAPWYTINSVTLAPDIATLDRNYEGISGSYPYIIGQFYVDFPTDLMVLEKVRDQMNGWYLVTHWYTQDYIDRVDSKRMSAGTPVIVVAAPSRTATDGTVIPRYEFWPRVQAEKMYQYRYRSLPELNSNSDRIMEVLNPQVLVFGALAQAAMWPGVSSKPNPFFNQQTFETYSKMYEEALQQSVLVDENRDQQMVKIGDDLQRRFPFDAKYLQDHIW
jgi:hypothetical protein